MGAEVVNSSSSSFWQGYGERRAAAIMRDHGIDPRELRERADRFREQLDEQDRNPSARRVARTASRRVQSATRHLWTNPILWIAALLIGIELVVIALSVSERKTRTVKTNFDFVNAGTAKAGNGRLLQSGSLTVRISYTLTGDPEHVLPARERIVDDFAFRPLPLEEAALLMSRDPYAFVARAKACGKVPERRNGRNDLDLEGCPTAESVAAGLKRTAVFAQFDASGAVTSMFLHGGLWHLIMNVSALLSLAPLVAVRLGALRFVAFFLVCGLGGSVAVWLIQGVAWAGWLPFGGRLPFMPVVGASGAIFGLAAAHVLLRGRTIVTRWTPAEPAELYGFVARILGLGIGLHALAIWFEIPLAWDAHLGGFLVGLVLFPFMQRSPQALRSYLRSMRDEMRPISSQTTRPRVDRRAAEV